MANKPYVNPNGIQDVTIKISLDGRTISRIAKRAKKEGYKDWETIKKKWIPRAIEKTLDYRDYKDRQFAKKKYGNSGDKKKG